MKTEHRFAQALKSMMVEKSLDEISVMALCKRCHVNRQTFYYHFHDIYDLLTLVFLDEKIKTVDNNTNFQDMIRNIYSYYESNKNFIDATLSSAGKDLFQEFIYNYCYQTTLEHINSYEVAKNITSNNKKNVARFYASAFTNSIIYYLINSQNKSLQGLLNTFNFLKGESLLKNLQNIVKKPIKV